MILLHLALSLFPGKAEYRLEALLAYFLHTKLCAFEMNSLVKPAHCQNASVEFFGIIFFFFEFPFRNEFRLNSALICQKFVCTSKFSFDFALAARLFLGHIAAASVQCFVSPNH